jgi:hypothetical protein
VLGEIATLRSTACDLRCAPASSPSFGRGAPAVKVNVSFHPLSMRILGTKAVALQPYTIAKLIEQPGRPGHRKIGGSGVMGRPSLSDMVNIMNHEVSTRRPGYRTCLITLLFRKMSDNSR